MNRLPDNPLITPADVPPTREDFEVFGVFNCAAFAWRGQTCLLLRVAERPVDEPGYVGVPVLDAGSGELVCRRLRRDDPGLDASDPRMVTLADGRILLTSISHLRLARSDDGRRFTVDAAPTVFPARPEEAFGLEDPRVTCIDGRRHITCTAVSDQGVTTVLIATDDWVEFERCGIIFAPEVKDVCLFPERVGGRFVCRLRPWSAGIGAPSVWTAFSGDLRHWGGYVHTMGPGEPGAWDDERVGCGPPPLKTGAGWLEVYHGADRSGRYGLGAMLSDLDDPTRVIGRSREPVLAPEADYETHGVYAPAVFSCGMVAQDDGRLRIYYGAADTVIACAETSVEELLDALE